MRVHLCGRLGIERDGDRAEETLSGRQLRLLFGYLVLHRTRPVRRDELVEAVWSGAPPAEGDALLRPLLSRLRRALGPERLEGRHELVLRLPDGAFVDFEAVGAELDRARAALASGAFRTAFDAARAAEAIAARGLLPGVDASWLEPFRTELDDRRAGLLEVVARAGARLGPAERGSAEQAARLAVESSPYRESARAALIEVLAGSGNVAEALLAYEDIRTLLRDELGSMPGAELRELHAGLLGTGTEPTAAGASGLPDRLSQAAGAAWVDRGDALARLRAAAEAAAAGATELILVTGEGGIGKTRLVAELAVGLDGFDVLYGRCDEEQLFPYGPWVEMLRARLSTMDRADRAALLGAAGGALTRLLPELRDPAQALDPPSLGADPDTERRQLFGAVTHVLARLAARRPLLIVVDDLHWADRASLLLGRHVAGEPRLGPILLIGTFRDTELQDGHPLPELLADLERHRPTPRLRLTGMDDAQVAELIRALQGADGVAPERARAIRGDTDGNPFFVKQLVRHLEETGGDAEALGVPQGARDVIARRVSRLPSNGGRMLSVAALIGRDFDFDLLSTVAEADDDALLDVLDAAVRGGLVQEVGPGRYSFAHALLRTTLEAELSLTRRARLHQRIGEAIEERYGDRLDAWLGELARHFAQAGPAATGRAVDYAVRAADQASLRLAHDDAAQLLRRAVSLRAGDPEALKELELALGTAQAAAGAFEAARASFWRAADVARTVGDGDAFARAALGHSGRWWERYGRVDAASVELLEEALGRLPDEDSPLRARVLARLAVGLYFSDGAGEGTAAAAAGATAMARRLGDPEALGAALSATVFARWEPGRSQDRLEMGGELIQIFEELQQPARAAEVHAMCAAACLELCRREEAMRHFERLSETAERFGDAELRLTRDGMRAAIAFLEGDFAGGAAIVEAVQAQAAREEALGLPPTPNLVGFEAGLVLVMRTERGGVAEFLPFMREAADIIEGMPAVESAVAYCAAMADEAVVAREVLDRLCADDFAALPRDAVFVTGVVLLAQAVAILGEDGLAPTLEATLAPHRDMWTLFGLGWGTAGPVAYSLGLLQLLQGRAADAVESLELAIDRSRSIGSPPYLARAQVALARALRTLGDDERAAELEAEASRTAGELGVLLPERELPQTRSTRSTSSAARDTRSRTSAAGWRQDPRT